MLSRRVVEKLIAGTIRNWELVHVATASERRSRRLTWLRSVTSLTSVVTQMGRTIHAADRTYGIVPDHSEAASLPLSDRSCFPAFERSPSVVWLRC